MHKRVPVEGEILGAGTDLFLSLFVSMMCVYAFLVGAGAKARRSDVVLGYRLLAIRCRFLWSYFKLIQRWTKHVPGRSSHRAGWSR